MYAQTSTTVIPIGCSAKSYREKGIAIFTMNDAVLIGDEKEDEL
jgi:hypothetical protein